MSGPSWMLFDDSSILLAEDGGIAIDELCCCFGCGCACSELQNRWHAGHQLKLTISSAIAFGPCNWPTLGSLPIICDAGWGPWNADGCTPIIEECKGLNLNTVYLYCPTEHGKTLNDLVCEASLSNLGCNFSTGNRAPKLGGEVAWTPAEIICDPDVSPSFYAKFIFPLESTAPGGCDGCPGEVIFEWESFGPLP